MNLLSGLDPYRLALYGVAAAAVLTFAGVKVHSYGAAKYAAGEAKVVADWNAAREDQEKNRAADQLREDEKERARRAKQKENEDAAAERLETALRDRDRAAGALDRLRRAGAAYAAATARPSGVDRPAAGGGSSAGSPGDVLPDLLGQCGERVRDLAFALDRSHAAGQLCERNYDAVTSASGQNSPAGVDRPQP